jgi:hypothetical protein
MVEATMDDDWGTRLERRITALETAIGHTDPEDVEIDQMIRRAVKALISLGWMMKWAVYLLAATAGAITAWNGIITQWKGLGGD